MMNIGFKNHLTTMDIYIRQSIKDNYETVENEIVQKCYDDINKKLKDLERGPFFEGMYAYISLTVNNLTIIMLLIYNESERWNLLWDVWMEK